ncbi:uncharacterized protein AMSG_01837 [Thecamonas trahens ATCC 50062]|uniref:Transmembrane protein n=1 Tax=Thecamonas trahens ATCC 50062 TaxID=461836 RepID=A0A0L0DVN6_THETB|nr:hypothetical protein AMSG_01837 [Thecamonas trahens ATCC 50062]KNC55573.1 hypothetical protein AMSG_01837 [Thecamonas trahens ATCC 50062]|eukprot:XP_013761347.1 hypothetical protein AMSG_01837 [Thecamonas trahens ATCC 50062]
MEAKKAAREAARKRLDERRQAMRAGEAAATGATGAGLASNPPRASLAPLAQDSDEEASTSWVSDGYTYTDGESDDPPAAAPPRLIVPGRGGAGEMEDADSDDTAAAGVRASGAPPSGRLPPLPAGGASGSEADGLGQTGGRRVLEPIRVGGGADDNALVLDPDDVVDAEPEANISVVRASGVYSGARAAPVGTYYRQTAKGAFTKTKDGPSGGDAGFGGGDGDAADSDTAASAQRRRNAILATTLAQSVVDSWAKLVSALFVFCQGCAAGLAITVFILSYVVTDRDNVAFLRVFSPMARSVQGLFFFFLSLAFLGAVDKYAKDKMGRWYGSWSRQGVDLLALALYALALFFTSLASSTSDVMYYAHERIPGWFEAPGAITSSFDSTLTQWHAYNNIRIWATIIAWAVLSLETTPYNINDSNYALHLRATGAQGVHAPAVPGQGAGPRGRVGIVSTE